MVETVGFRQVLWLVMLESTKNQILGVYTPGQQVPLRVRYGTTCLVITDPMGSVPCSDEWKWHGHSLGPTWCKRGYGTAYYPKKP
jgi:hypothetical protein